MRSVSRPCASASAACACKSTQAVALISRTAHATALPLHSNPAHPPCRPCHPQQLPPAASQIQLLLPQDASLRSTLPAHLQHLPTLPLHGQLLLRLGQSSRQLLLGSAAARLRIGQGGTQALQEVGK